MVSHFELKQTELTIELELSLLESTLVSVHVSSFQYAEVEDLTEN